jgi:hypothetical protein
LYWACEVNKWEVAELLLRRGANPDAKDKASCSMIIWWYIKMHEYYTIVVLAQILQTIIILAFNTLIPIIAHVSSDLIYNSF